MEGDELVVENLVKNEDEDEFVETDTTVFDHESA